VAWSEEHDLGFAILLNAEANSINELTTTFWEMAFTRLGTVALQNVQKTLTAAGRTSP